MLGVSSFWVGWGGGEEPGEAVDLLDSPFDKTCIEKVSFFNESL